MNGARRLGLWTLAVCVVTVIVGWALSGWLKSHAELAAWVQAVGSVAAIISTGIYVQWQHGLENQRREIEDLQMRRRRLEVVVELARATAASVRWVQAQLVNREQVQSIAEGETYLDRRVVAELGKLLSAIPLHELDDPTVATEVVYLLHHAQNMSGLVEQLFQLHGKLTAAEFDHAFEAFQYIAKECETNHKNMRKRLDAISPK